MSYTKFRLQNPSSRIRFGDRRSGQICLLFAITSEGHGGTSDQFATNPFHIVLFSSALVELVKSIPGHSLILSLHLFFCLPLLLFLFIFPVR